MSKPLRTTGKFKAYVRALAVTESPQKKLPQLAIEIGCYEMEMQLKNADGSPQLDAGGRAVIGFAPLDDEYAVIDYLPLAYFDDQEAKFTKTFENIQEAFRWTPDPGRLWESLQEVDISSLRIQVVIQEDEYQGRQQFNIAFINPEDYVGASVRPLDATVLSQLSNQWAGVFRAKFGTSGAGAAAPAPAPAAAPAAAPAPAATVPAPAPAPVPNAAPAPAVGAAPSTAPPVAAPAAAPAASTTSPAPAGSVVAAGSTPDEAWTAFNAANERANTKLASDALQLEWYRILKDRLSAADANAIAALTPEQWAWMRDSGAGDIVPF